MHVTLVVLVFGIDRGKRRRHKADERDWGVVTQFWERREWKRRASLVLIRMVSLLHLSLEIQNLTLTRCCCFGDVIPVLSCSGQSSIGRTVNDVPLRNRDIRLPTTRGRMVVVIQARSFPRSR